MISKILYDISWIQNRKTNIKDAFKFFFLFLIVYTFIMGIFLYVSINPIISQVEHTILTQTPNFKATMQNGILTINELKQPYVIRNSQSHSPMILFDTKHNPEITDSSTIALFKQKGGVIIQKTGITVYQSSPNKIETHLWKNTKIPNGSLTKIQLFSVIKKIMGWFVLLLIPILYIGLCIMIIIPLLIVTLLVNIVTSLTKKQLTYKELLSIGLYAVVLPVLVNFIIADLLHTNIPFLFSLLLFIWMLAIIFHKNETPKPDKLRKVTVEDLQPKTE